MKAEDACDPLWPADRVQSHYPAQHRECNAKCVAPYPYSHDNQYFRYPRSMLLNAVTNCVCVGCSSSPIRAILGIHLHFRKSCFSFPEQCQHTDLLCPSLCHNWATWCLLSTMPNIVNLARMRGMVISLGSGMPSPYCCPVRLWHLRRLSQPAGSLLIISEGMRYSMHSASGHSHGSKNGPNVISHQGCTQSHIVVTEIVTLSQCSSSVANENNDYKERYIFLGKYS